MAARSLTFALAVWPSFAQLPRSGVRLDLTRDLRAVDHLEILERRNPIPPDNHSQNPARVPLGMQRDRHAGRQRARPNARTSGGHGTDFPNRGGKVVLLLEDDDNNWRVPIQTRLRSRVSGLAVLERAAAF